MFFTALTEVSSVQLLHWSFEENLDTVQIQPSVTNKAEKLNKEKLKARKKYLHRSLDLNTQ